MAREKGEHRKSLAPSSLLVGKRLPRRAHASEALPLWRRLTSLSVLVLVPILSGVIPVLDVAAEDMRVGIEDHHHPGTHGYAHNHLICIQQDANQWAPFLDLPRVPEAVNLGCRSAPDQFLVPLFKTFHPSPYPRGPPSA